MDNCQLLRMAARLGRLLMVSGAEIYRVEESVGRALSAYGLEAQVLAIPNCLIVSIDPPGGQPVTQMYRIAAHGTDIELLERCNELCRRLCREVPPVEEAQRLVEALEPSCRRFSPPVTLFAYAGTAAFFALFFGGNAREWLCAGLDGLAVGAVLLFGGRLIGSNTFFRMVLCSAAASLIGLLSAAWAGAGAEIVTIAALMLLVPGVAITNAMREIMAADIISGLNRTAEALLVGSAIALGTAIPLLLEGGPPTAGLAVSPLAGPPLLPCLWAFCACVFFGVVFNIQGVGVLICGLGGSLGWFVYLVSSARLGSDIPCAFLAAMSISAYAEVMARIRRCPATGYLQVALLPLVPGAGIYNAMSCCLAGASQLFLSTLLHILGFAAALSVGAMLVASVSRALFPRLRRVKQP